MSPEWWENFPQLVGKCPIDIDIDIELELELDIEKEIEYIFSTKIYVCLAARRHTRKCLLETLVYSLYTNCIQR